MHSTVHSMAAERFQAVGLLIGQNFQQQHGQEAHTVPHLVQPLLAPSRHRCAPADVHLHEVPDAQTAAQDVKVISLLLCKRGSTHSALGAGPVQVAARLTGAALQQVHKSQDSAQAVLNAKNQ